MKKGFYRHYLLGLLTLISAFNFVDRHFLSLALQDIKVSLQLSDTQLGLLTGISFAIFYAIMGIPIARWTDTGNRATVVSSTTFLFGVAVSITGSVSNFIQLLVLRIVTAIGEAGTMPTANSLIPEYFSRRERPRAASIYMIGGSISVAIGFLGGGLLNEAIGWRRTFAVLGAPGVLLAILAWFTIQEPRQNRGKLEKRKDLPTEAIHNSRRPPKSPSVIEAFVALWRIRSFRHLLAAYTASFFFGSGIAVWMPSFFIRTHSMETGELGVWMTIIYGGVGGIAILSGGELASRFAAGKEKVQFMVGAAFVSAFSLVSVYTYLTPNKYVALALMMTSTFAVLIVNGPLFAAIQSLVMERMRAMAIAIVYLFANLIGLGLGPLFAGALSDYLAPTFGVESLRYSLVILAPGYLWMALHLFLASRCVEQDMLGVKEDPKF